MKLGVTGTRLGMTGKQHKTLTRWLTKQGTQIEEFHHGDCVGADVEAAAEVHAHDRNILITAYPGNISAMRGHGTAHKILKSKNPLTRNRDIVDAVDTLLAFPNSDREKSQGGTWYTVRYARQERKPVVIIWPDGSVREEREVW